MAAIVITPEVDKQIREFSSDGLTVTAICKKLKLKYDTVASHMHKNKIKRNYETTKSVGRPPSKFQVPEGIFNEHERENWLV